MKPSPDFDPTASAQPDNARRPIPWIRGGSALLLALFVMGATLPNVGRVVIDHTTTSQTVHVEYRFSDCAMLVGLALLPVVCIFFLGRRWPAAEAFGWVVLLLLIIGVFAI